MKRSVVSLAAIAALAPALACASRSVSVGSPAAGSASASNTRTIGSVGAPVGLQLWSLRSMSKDPAAMFSLARSMGVTHVETAGLYGMTPEQFAAGLKAADLRATSMHIGLDEFKKNPQSVIGTAKALGVKYVGTAWYPHQGAFTEADARKAIADFNAIGKQMKAAGLLDMDLPPDFTVPNPAGASLDEDPLEGDEQREFHQDFLGLAEEK